MHRNGPPNKGWLEIACLFEITAGGEWNLADLITKGLASHWTISYKIYRNEGYLVKSNDRHANCTVAFVLNQLFDLRNTLKGSKLFKR